MNPRSDRKTNYALSQAKVSFVIPAFNEAEYIQRCLSSIVQACGDTIDYEIIVVDNGSTDNTYDLAKTYTKQVFSIDRSSVSAARNLGANKAVNKLIAFVDGDVELTSRWVKNFNDRYSNLVNEPFFVTGCQCVVPRECSWIEKYWFSNLEDQLLGGANIITSKKAFEKLSGFDESLKTGEDYDFCLRAVDLNISFTKDNNFEAIHLGFPKNLKSFWIREYWHGEGDFKSLERIKASLVAKISLLYVLLLVLIVSLPIYDQYLWCALATLILVAVNFAITIKRFYRCSVKAILLNSLLNYVYFFARAASVQRALANRQQPH